MRLSKYLAASTEAALMFPALLFMAALFVRNLQPTQYQPAHTAEQIVVWYSQRTHLALWVFLMAMPLTVLITGLAVLLKRWRRDDALRMATKQAWEAIRGHFATAVIAAATVSAGGVLAIVALHLLTD